MVPVIGKILLIFQSMEILHVIQREVGSVCRGHINVVNMKRVWVVDVKSVIIQVKKHRVNTYQFLFINMDLYLCYRKQNKNRPLKCYTWQLYEPKVRILY